MIKITKIDDDVVKRDIIIKFVKIFLDIFSIKGYKIKPNKTTIGNLKNSQIK